MSSTAPNLSSTDMGIALGRIDPVQKEYARVVYLDLCNVKGKRNVRAIPFKKSVHFIVEEADNKTNRVIPVGEADDFSFSRIEKMLKIEDSFKIVLAFVSHDGVSVVYSELSGFKAELAQSPVRSRQYNEH